MTQTMPEDLDPVNDALEAVIERHLGRTDGAVAGYIPELGRVDPEPFGLAMMSVHGRLHRAGDVQVEFTIQSSSKPFVYALALAELGLEHIAEHVGFEPSGEPFNAISLDPTTGRPENPLINAGAIVTSSLVPGDDPAERFERVLDGLSRFAGRELSVDEQVYESESATGDRNRALAHLARSAGVLGSSVEAAVEVYFRQCSVLVTTLDLAVMGTTLANGGVNPMTEERIVDTDVARTTLSIMASCGMYDSSGDWLVRVGLPAKSGVGGGIVAAAPGQFGIGVFSPRLDRTGNSVRGVEALRTLSSEYGLHLLQHPAVRRSPIVSTRDEDRGHVVVLRGELDFISAEEVVGHLTELDSARSERRIVLDVTGVTRVRPAAERLLAATAERLEQRGLELFAIDTSGVLEGHTTDAGSAVKRIES